MYTVAFNLLLKSHDANLVLATATTTTTNAATTTTTTTTTAKPATSFKNFAFTSPFHVKLYNLYSQ